MSDLALWQEFLEAANYIISIGPALAEPFLK